MPDTGSRERMGPVLSAERRADEKVMLINTHGR